jgi:uncharacterized protein involved in exopolysaccharide biosynthesis
MDELNFSNHNGEGVRSTTLRDFFTVVFRHRRLVVISFLTIFSASILVALLQPNHYDAAMKILVKRERVDPVVTTETSALPQLAVEVTEEEMNSELELLKSRDLLENVVLACDLLHRQGARAWYKVLAPKSARTGPDRPEKGAQTARAVRALEKDLKLDVLKKTNIISLNYESSNPELAARVLTTLANLYLEKHLAVHRPPGAFNFFQQQTQEYGKGLADAEARLVNFTHGADVVSAQLEKEGALQKAAEFDATLKQTQAAIRETQQRIHVLEEQSASTPTRIVTQVRNTDDALLISQLRSDLLTLELKRTELLDKFEPSYRPVQEVEAQIAQTRAAIAAAEKSPLRDEATDRDPTYEWVKGELAKAKADLAGLQARAEATARTVESYQEKARALEQKEVVQDDLIRTVKAKEENYQLYLRKEEEARISDALDRRRIINVAIAEAATVPSLPSNHRAMTVLVGLVLATLTSLALAFGSEHLDPTFRTPDELTSFLNIPVLAAMPRNEKTEKNNLNGKDIGTPHVS